jgi:acetyl/propionyl-CoA carboxylase alpha subunit
MKLTFLHAGEKHELDIRAINGSYAFVAKGKSYSARTISRGEEELQLDIDGVVHEVVWARQGRKTWLHIDGRTYELEKPAARASASGTSGSGSLRAPMPGQVRKVMVQEGELVQAGAVLLVLEAMKMEIRIQAPVNAKVALVNVKEGQSIEKDQLLVELEI